MEHSYYFGGKLKPILAKRLAEAAALIANAAWVCATSLAANAGTPSFHIPSAPIQHVIVIAGENHTYDNLFGAYSPRQGRTLNLLSEGIIKKDGSPGPNWRRAQQWQPQDTGQYAIVQQRTQPYSSPPPRVMPESLRD
ncbi:MAG: hypothetical protein ABSG46_08090 [Candidatus Binataceae bacterium]